MGLHKAELPSGWGIVPRAELKTINPDSLSDALFLLGDVDKGLAYSFRLAVQQQIVTAGEHPLSAISMWFENEAIMVEGFPVVDSINNVPTKRELKDLYPNVPLARPYFFQLSEYTTKSGKKGFALVVHEINMHGEDSIPTVGNAVVAYRAEERQPGKWVEYDVTPDMHGRLDFLSEIASEIRECQVLIHPGEPYFVPPGGGQRFSMKRAA